MNDTNEKSREPSDTEMLEWLLSMLCSSTEDADIRVVKLAYQLQRMKTGREAVMLAMQPNAPFDPSTLMDLLVSSN